MSSHLFKIANSRAKYIFQKILTIEIYDLELPQATWKEKSCILHFEMLVSKAISHIWYTGSSIIFPSNGWESIHCKQLSP